MGKGGGEYERREGGGKEDKKVNERQGKKSTVVHVHVYTCKCRHNFLTFEKVLTASIARSGCDLA